MLKGLFKKIINLYSDGFRNMKVGKTLWLVILVKLFVILVVLKFFIYDKNLNSQFKNDEEKTDYVLKNLTKEKK